MKALTIALLLSMLSGCTGKHPFLMVQLCLNDNENTDQFVDLMKSVSELHQMKYVDRSEASQRELTQLKKNPDYRLVNISARDEKGVGWGAGNFGLSAYEMSIGFSEGSDPVSAHAFAKEVVERLSAKWSVYTVPSNRGAKPMCQQQK